MTGLPPGKKRRYKSLDVNRVDLVDRGANFDRATGDGSHILLVKRDDQQELPMPGQTQPEAADIQKMIADALAAERATQKADRDAAIAKAVEDAKAAAKAEAEAEKAALAKRAEDAEKAAKEASDIAKAEQERREIAQAEAVAKAFSDVGMTSADGGLVYRMAKALTADDNKRVHELFAAAAEQIRVGKLFAAQGRTGEPPAADVNGNPEQVLMAKADALRAADPALSQADAVDKACMLYPAERNAYQAWKRTQITGRPN